MMKKKLVIISVVSGLILTLCACGENDRKTVGSKTGYDRQYNTDSGSSGIGESQSYQSEEKKNEEQSPADSTENEQSAQAENSFAAIPTDISKTINTALTGNGAAADDKEVRTLEEAIMKDQELLAALKQLLIMHGTGDDEKRVQSEDKNTIYGGTREVLSIKNAYIPQYSNEITLGDALDAFLSNPRWDYLIEKRSPNEGRILVKCYGEFWYNNKNITANISFPLNDFRITNNSTFTLGVQFGEFGNIREYGLSYYSFFDMVYKNAADLGIRSEKKGNGAAFINDEIFREDAGARLGLNSGSAYTGGMSQNSSSNSSWNGSSEDYIASYKLDKERFERDDLEKMSKSDVRILINAMYAYHGYTFNSEEIGRFFSRTSWYTSRGKSTEDCEAEFNDCEYYNKELFVGYEKEMGWR